MSRSEDRQREDKAHWKGYHAGLAGEPADSNPYKLGTSTYVHWSHGHEHGISDRKRKRMDCSDCDALTLQRITTRGTFCNVEFVERVPGKKPYKVRCRKCKREWITGAEYARHLSGDAWRAEKALKET